MAESPATTSSDAILAVLRLLGEPAQRGLASARAALVHEARALFGAAAALLLEVDRAAATCGVLAAEPAGAPAGPHPLAAFPAVRDLLDTRLELAQGSLEGTPLAADGATAGAAGEALLVALPEPGEIDHVLVLVAEAGRSFTGELRPLAIAFAAAAAAALTRVHDAEDHARRAARQSALAQAAKTLHANLDLPSLLGDICAEARAIVDGDQAAVHLGDERGLVVEAVDRLGPEVLGYRMARGHGLANRAAETGRPAVTGDYQAEMRPEPGSPFADVRSALAVPMRWDGALRGVLAVGYTRPHAPSPEEVALLETFAELAAAACRNANAATGLALASRIDALTGCLNHAALQDGLRREIERGRRTEQRLSLVLLDLDGFKQVNEQQGHLAGDEVLRRVGHALRATVRPYDLCARYGGDEFAIICADTDEHAAAEIARRAIEGIVDAVADLEGAAHTTATAGVAPWSPDHDATALLEEADRALLWAKQHGRRGDAVLAADVEPGYRPGRFRRAGAPAVLAAASEPRPAPEGLHAQRQAERLQKRTRQLVLANALGARLAGMHDAAAIVDAAVDELHRAFGYYLCAVIRLRDDDMVEAASLRGKAFVRLGRLAWSQPRHLGVIGRALREQRVVLVNDVSLEPAYEATSETAETRAELVAPIWVHGQLWGAVNVEESRVDAFDIDDARLVQTVADQVGAALRTAELYERLERAYLGTAEALAAALEARDATLGQAASIVACCEAVARRLGMDEAAIRDLRHGAALHDIGKIAVPEAILAKPGPLDPPERAVVQRHPVVGEQILAPVEFLAGVAPLVRHEHERWDGGGYPDRLAGASIPLGARVIFACDAYHAMLSDRPYRAALSEAQARAEMRRQAGSQFDPAVVDALLAVLEAEVASG